LGVYVRVSEKRGVQLLAIPVLAALAIWVIDGISARMLTQRRLPPAHPLAVMPAPTRVKEGERIVHIDGCFGCHGPQLTGRIVATGWMGGRIVAPNLTRIVPKDTDTQLAATIRYGVKPDGTSVVVMPSSQFIKSSDSDIAAIIAYLRTLPERQDTAGDNRWRFGTRMMLVTGLLPLQATIVNELERGPLWTPSEPLALGQYLTQSHCAGCHGSDLSGETIESSPDLRVAVQHYSLAAFDHFFKTGEGQLGHGTRTMTRVIQERFKYLTTPEVDAIYRYLKHDSNSY
jgi:mono/diheme cytochrome c family protein